MERGLFNWLLGQVHSVTTAVTVPICIAAIARIIRVTILIRTTAVEIFSSVAVETIP
jgi:hypothetical protein